MPSIFVYLKNRNAQRFERIQQKDLINVLLCTHYRNAACYFPPCEIFELSKMVLCAKPRYLSTLLLNHDIKWIIASGHYIMKYQVARCLRVEISYYN